MDKLLSDAGAKYNDYDANGNQTTQTEQITTAIAKGAKMLIVNVVDTGSNDAAQNIIDMAKEKDIPVIFFNRSVDETVVSSYVRIRRYRLRNGRTYAGRNDRRICSRKL